MARQIRFRLSRKHFLGRERGAITATGVFRVMLCAERVYMKVVRGSFVGVVLAGILALASCSAFGHAGAGGGHGGGFGHGGMGSDPSGGGGSTPSSFNSGHAYGGRGFAFAGRGFRNRDRDHFFLHDHDRFFFGTGFGFYEPSWYWDNPYYAYDYPYYGYYFNNAGGYTETTVAVQRELARLGYYRGPIDGVVGPETRQAISWFQSVDKLSVTGEIDSATLRALRMS
jgi:hypothetical protein